MVISGMYCSIWELCDVYVLDAGRLSGIQLIRICISIQKHYDSSNGREVFLAYQDKDESVFGYLRLRMPSLAHIGQR